MLRAVRTWLLRFDRLMAGHVGGSMIGHGHARLICGKRIANRNSRNNSQHGEHAENNKAAVGDRFNHGAIIVRFETACKAVAIAERETLNNRIIGTPVTA